MKEKDSSFNNSKYIFNTSNNDELNMSNGNFNNSQNMPQPLFHNIKLKKNFENSKTESTDDPLNFTYFSKEFGLFSDKKPVNYHILKGTIFEKQNIIKIRFYGSFKEEERYSQ